MKLYQYDDLKKANQALGSFKRNGIQVINVDHAIVENKVLFLVLTDSDKPEKEENGEKKEKPKAKKAKDSAGKPVSAEGKAPADEKAAEPKPEAK